MSRIPTTSTLIPQFPFFPNFLPSPPKPHPKPLPQLGRAPKRVNDYRDLFQELEDLSEEETEIEDIVSPFFYFEINQVAGKLTREIREMRSKIEEPLG